jgi:glycosyltransferase involved in cell wall biosynthesis
MNIVIISQYFQPERSAASNRISNLVKAWVGNHNLTVISQVPNYPEGKIYPGYSMKWCFQEDIDSVHVLRTWVVTTRNSGSFRRFTNYLSFLFSSVVVGMWRLKETDCILASSPQLLNGLAGYFLSIWKRCPFIFDVRDLWPDSLAALHAVNKRGIVFKLLQSMERFLYRKAKIIITVTEGMKEQIHQKGIPIDKISVIPNSIDRSIFRTSHRNRETLGLPENKIIACYAGNHSRAQNLRKLFLSIVRSHEMQLPIYYLFIGEGEDKDWLKRQAAEKKLANVRFINMLDRAALIEYEQASDVCIASLHPDPLFFTALPTKILEYLACGKPVLFFGKNEFMKKISEFGLGISVPTEFPGQVPDAIIKLSKLATISNFEANANTLLDKHFSQLVFNTNCNKVLKNIVYV